MKRTAIVIIAVTTLIASGASARGKCARGTRGGAIAQIVIGVFIPVGVIMIGTGGSALAKHNRGYPSCKEANPYKAAKKQEKAQSSSYVATASVKRDYNRLADGCWVTPGGGVTCEQAVPDGCWTTYNGNLRCPEDLEEE
jgi:hypothetical protein